jgi:TDG/mug DNA glycosylase family protein
VTLYRAILPLVGSERPPRRIPLGPQPILVHGARIHVLPNPSGRNANFSYEEMLAAFRGLRRALKRAPAAKP